VVDQLEFAVEEIPDGDEVFMRAHQMFFPRGMLTPGVFRAHQGGMSVNWSKYASPQQTQQQATKDPHNNAVLGLIVGSIRAIKGLDVKHSPEATNRAHSEVALPTNDEDLTEVRLLLLRICTIVIPFAAPR
jgi:hypothetical protein